MAAFGDVIKNIFYIFLLLQIAPVIIKSLRTNYNDILTTKTKLGVITVTGTLSTASTTLKSIKKIFEDPSIKGVFLKVDSPGGVAGTSQTIFREINYFKNLYPKYVICFVENVAASGGFYVACAADYIIASPSAFIGSIGSYIQHPFFKDFIEKHNIKYEIIKSGKFKGAGSPFLELTPEQTAHFQSITDDTYKQFVRDVALHRPNVPADPKIWAEGKIFTGEQALALKLIDEVGSPSNALKIFREKGHFEGDIEWVKPGKKQGFLQALFDQDAGNDDEPTYLHSWMKTICTFLETRYSSHIRY
ncbi:signal peptide peptidase SppA [Candidatus Dependentiae bacterium]|nr:signal peptide peptidase SppA [Candidatus Dependentiae bacterium]